MTKSSLKPVLEEWSRRPKTGLSMAQGGHYQRPPKVLLN